MPCLQITWAKPGRGVSCLSRAPGMSVCLGTKRKCLWSIWAGRGQGAVYLLEGVCVCVCVSRPVVFAGSPWGCKREG